MTNQELLVRISYVISKHDFTEEPEQLCLALTQMFVNMAEDPKDMAGSINTAAHDMLDAMGLADKVPADEAPSTKCAKSLLACDNYEALDAWVAKYTKNDVFTAQAVDALNYASNQVDTDLSVMILSNLTW